MTRKEEIEKGLTYFKKNKDRLSFLYKQMYGEDICFTCPGSNLEYAFKKIYKDRDRELPNFRMKRGCVINTMMVDIDGIPKGHFNVHNMTNDLAKKLIENGYGSYFL